MKTGWIKLHRSLINWGWYHNETTFKLFIHLLLTVNTEDKEWNGAKVKAGSVVTSIDHLSKEIRKSQQQTRTAISNLISTNEITKHSTSHYTVITVVNWEKYQIDKSKPTNKTTNKATLNQQTNNKQSTTTKEYKNKRNKEKINYQNPSPDFSGAEFKNKNFAV